MATQPEQQFLFKFCQLASAMTPSNQHYESVRLADAINKYSSDSLWLF